MTARCTRPVRPVQSSSAAGKSSLMEAVLAFVPPEDKVKYSAMTGQSLYYLGESDIKHKVLAIVEEEGAEKASYRVVASDVVAVDVPPPPGREIVPEQLPLTVVYEDDLAFRPSSLTLQQCVEIRRQYRSATSAARRPCSPV